MEVKVKETNGVDDESTFGKVTGIDPGFVINFCSSRQSATISSSSTHPQWIAAAAFSFKKNRGTYIASHICNMRLHLILVSLSLSLP